MIASRRGDADLVKALLSAGASGRLRNRDRMTAADVAEARGFPTISELLNRA
jgi:ankyrin repeat protein